MSEVELVRGLKNKEITSYDFLYDRYAPALYGMILKMLPDGFNASKVLINSFAESWKRIESYDNSKSGIFMWLVTITIEQCNGVVNQPGVIIRKENGFNAASFISSKSRSK